MQDVLKDNSEPQSAAEQLLEDSWETRTRRASQRELLAEGGAAVGFLLAAGALALAVSAAVPWATVLLLITLYTLVARIEFPVGSGYVVPTQLVLVPMLMALPAGIVPVAVATGLVASSVIDWSLGRVPARRILSAVPDAWHAVGPALVLVAIGAPERGFDGLEEIGFAFVACCATDFATSFARIRLVGVAATVKAQAGMMLTVWAVDACLAPLGVVAANATGLELAAVVFLLPLALLLWLLARDRSRRIEQAQARLRLVEHERGRLQSAVRRLGDAFATKLDLEALLGILLQGAIDALDADTGELELDSLPSPVRLKAGDAHAPEPQHDLSIPIRVETTATSLATGALRVARAGRAFEPDEDALLRELVAKAELAAAEILAHERLREQAVTDALTGLGNRRRLSRDLAQTLERATPERATLLLLFDLDGFKAYNDTFGHLAGDQLLARLGDKLAGAVAGDGAAYRLGGDEFCALLRLGEGTDVDDLIARAAAALTERGPEFTIGASLGAVLLPHEADSPDHALQLADERMYAGKRGRASGPRDQARDVLMRTMQAKQPDLDEHASEVAALAVRVARRLGLRGEALDEIARAAELHDVGKVGIPDAILAKPGPLNPGEWEFMHQHTVLGERILNAAPALRPVARIVRASHERWDGTGYPDRLAGEQIPLGARIVAVCDAYEAMTADRSYRLAMTPAAARAELRAHAGRQFDPQVVDAFLAAEHQDSEPAAPAAQTQAAAAHITALLHQSALP